MTLILSPLRSKATFSALALACLAGMCGSAFGASKLKLHVPSPDWRDQVIYFLMTDRFEDGNPSNNDQGAGEYNPQKSSHFSGGDLAGVKKRLDYIQGLGATSVWVTPPVLNQWWNGTYGGYHGYWAADFKRMEQLSIVKMADKYHELAQHHERFQKEAETLAEAEAARKASSANVRSRDTTKAPTEPLGKMDDTLRSKFNILEQLKHSSQISIKSNALQRFSNLLCLAWT